MLACCARRRTSPYIAIRKPKLYLPFLSVPEGLLCVADAAIIKGLMLPCIRSASLRVAALKRSFFLL